MTARPLSGILPVLQIPFRHSGLLDHVDDDLLRREVDFCIKCGAHGLVIPALASEFMVLTNAERRQVVASTVEQTKGRVPVVANVAAPSSQAAVEFAHHAREVGASSVMALPPYVRKPTIDGVMDYYAAIAEAAQLPVIVQNAPPPFGVSLPTPVVLRLVEEIPHVNYIKEERLPPTRNIGDVIAGASPKLQGVFGGMAGMHLPNELARGVIGSMPSAGVCDVLVTIFDAWRAGDYARARAIHQQILPLLVLEMSAWMALSKDVLCRRGVFTNTIMRDPEFLQLDAGDMAEIDALWPQIAPLFS